MRRVVLIALSILLSAILLWLVLHDVPLKGVEASIQNAKLLWVLLSFMAVLLGLWTRAVRWRALLDDALPLRPAFFIIGITFMLNQLPLRAGEVARSLIVTRHAVPLVTAATSILVERLLDTLLVVLLLVLAVLRLPDVPPSISSAARLFGIAGLGSFIVLLFFAHRPHMAEQMLNVLLRFAPVFERLPLRQWLHHALDGLQPLTAWYRLGHALLWTLISWAFSLLSLYALARALDIQQGIWLVTILGVTLVSLSIAIPVSVAGIGLFEGALLVAGQLAVLTEIEYTALGFLYHGITIFGYLVIGVLGMLALGLSLSEVFRAQKRYYESPDEAQG